jgi:hypothetical protein
MSEVIVVGGGPTGLWLAAELCLAGVSVEVLEARAQRSPRSKAITLHARTLEVLAMRGLAGQFVNSGAHLLTYHFGMLEQKMPLADLDSPFPFVLAHSQVQTEEKIERRARELGVDLLRGHTATGVQQDEDGVTVTVTTPDGDEQTRRASYLVGCDGSRSVVRQAVGIIRGMTPEGLALRGLMNRLIANHPSLVAALIEELTGIDVAYPVAGAHPLTGVRLPAPEAVLTLLANGKPLLLTEDDIPRSRAEAEKRGFSVATAPLSTRPAWAGVAAVVVRPDGHVWLAVDRSPDADDRLVKDLADLKYY